MYDEYDEPDEIDKAFMAMCQAFATVLPDADNSFGHVVIQDFNFHISFIDWSLEHIDDHYADVVKERGEPTAKVWRDAVYHLLMCMKTISDALPENVG